jgi:hypothetical protein
VVLCHELPVLRRQVSRPGLRPADRARFGGQVEARRHSVTYILTAERAWCQTSPDPPS